MSPNSEEETKLAAAFPWKYDAEQHVDDHLFSDDEGHTLKDVDQDFGFPCRWLKYSNFNAVVKDSRFLPLKCPLDKEYFNQNTDHKHRYFTIGSVMRALDKLDQKVGLIIDVSGGKRQYYKKERLDKYGIEYLSMPVPGLDLKALEEAVPSFNKAVSEYLEKHANDNSLIAVHCTHGINRTGYLICRYLVGVCGWDADAAIEGFNTARGHDMERDRYLTSIRKSANK